VQGVLLVQMDLLEQVELLVRVVLLEHQDQVVLQEQLENRVIKEVYYINLKLHRFHQVNLPLIRRHQLVVLIKYTLMMLRMTEQLLILI
jgi:hypothetical protein